MSQELILSGVIIFVLAVAIPVIFLATKNLGPKNPNIKNKNLTYESGVSTQVGDIGSRHNVRFYLVAILFIIFDVEIIFLFPWAVNVRELGTLGLVEIFLFVFLLVAGLVYVYMKKALKWQ
jgi:NADH-quinone oxidoreductase subunit A